MAHTGLTDLPTQAPIGVFNFGGGKIERTPTAFTSFDQFGGTIQEGGIYQEKSGPTALNKFYTFSGGQIRPIISTGNNFRQSLTSAGYNVGDIQGNVIGDFSSYANKFGLKGFGEAIDVKGLSAQQPPTTTPIDPTSSMRVEATARDIKRAGGVTSQADSTSGQGISSLGRLLGPREFEALRIENRVSSQNFEQYFNRDEKGNIYLRPDAPLPTAQIGLGRPPFQTKGMPSNIVLPIKSKIPITGDGKTLSQTEQEMNLKTRDLQRDAITASQLGQKPVPTDQVLSGGDPQYLAQLQSIPDQQKDAVFVKYGISQRLKNIETMESRILSEVQAFDEELANIRSNPDLSRTLAERRASYIENIKNKSIQALQLQYQFLNRAYEQHLSAAKDELGITERARAEQIQVTEARQAERNRIRDDARANIQLFTSSGALGEFTGEALRSLEQQAELPTGSLNTLSIEVKSGNERRIAKTQAELTKIQTDIDAKKTNIEIQEERLKLQKQELAIKQKESEVAPKRTESEQKQDQIPNIVQKLNESSDKDGYANPKMYQRLRAFSKFSASEFDNRFSGSLSIDDRAKLNIQSISKKDLPTDKLSIVNDAQSVLDRVKSQYGDVPAMRDRIIKQSIEQFGFDPSPYL